MIELPIYPLAKAAEKIGRTVDDLINLAENAEMMPNEDDRLYLYAKLSGKRAERITRDIDVEMREVTIIEDLCRLPAVLFQNYRPENTLKGIWVKAFDGDVYYRLLDPITLGDINLLVLADDVKRLSGASIVKNAETITTSNPNKSDRLAILNQASERYWSNANRSDKSTWPDNKVVSSWLMNKEFSKRLADSGATIIRPEWAVTGRK